MAERVFLAIDIDDRAREQLARLANRLAACPGKINWVAPQNLHVTMNFIGAIDDGMLGELTAAVASSTGRCQPFDFGLRGVVCIPPERRLRMLWVGVEQADEILSELHHSLTDELSALGLAGDEKKFVPHVTLARIKFTKDPEAIRIATGEYAQTDFGTCLADRVTIYASTLTPQGAIYTPLAEAKMGAG